MCVCVCVCVEAAYQMVPFIPSGWTRRRQSTQRRPSTVTRRVGSSSRLLVRGDAAKVLKFFFFYRDVCSVSSESPFPVFFFYFFLLSFSKEPEKQTNSRRLWVARPTHDIMNTLFTWVFILSFKGAVQEMKIYRSPEFADIQCTDLLQQVSADVVCGLR